MNFDFFTMLRQRKNVLATSIINIFEFIAAFLHFNKSGDLRYYDPLGSFIVVHLIITLFA